MESSKILDEFYALCKGIAVPENIFSNSVPGNESILRSRYSDFVKVSGSYNEHLLSTHKTQHHDERVLFCIRHFRYCYTLHCNALAA